jgi:hypothetical protein
MSKTKISDYSSTPADNTDIGGINIAEGMLPSDVNNAIREQMAQLKNFQSGTSGESVTFATVNATTISASNINKVTVTAPATGATLTIADGKTLTANATLNLAGTDAKTLTVNNSLTLAGTDATTMTFPSTSATIARTDAAQTFTGAQTFSDTVTATKLIPTGNVTAGNGMYLPTTNTLAFSTNGSERVRVDSAGNVGIGTSSPASPLHVAGDTRIAGGNTTHLVVRGSATGRGVLRLTSDSTARVKIQGLESDESTPLALSLQEAGGNVGIGTSSPQTNLAILGGTSAGITNTTKGIWIQNTGSNYSGLTFCDTTTRTNSSAFVGMLGTDSAGAGKGALVFATRDVTTDTAATERMRIDSSGIFYVAKTTTALANVGIALINSGKGNFTVDADEVLNINRLTNDGNLIRFYQATTEEGSISVSGNTVSYNAFSGGHWSQLQQGRGYNPDIPRGTVMSTIGEMCEWKSVEWTETTEHPAIPAVEAKEAVLDEEGNVIEPAVEAVEGKDAWTETFDKRETYFGDLPVGATFEEDGFTKTVVDDGNERLPKVKISDVVGDKAVYGVFQTWDEAQDMLVTSLGAFVVRIAAGVTVEIGDLLESNGDGCAKVQDDDVIRSKTIAKVTSTTPAATYDDGSYTVPAVIYCG